MSEHHVNGRTNGHSGALARAVEPLDIGAVFDGARLVIMGGTGFLGKIFWLMLLDRFPQIGKIFLMVRSGKGGGSSEERFWKDVATSEALKPLRDRYGEGYEAFLREKIEPIDGDMGRERCGVDPVIVGSLRGTIDAVVNVAGVVDFNPPLDEALDANAFGSQNLVDLARALGDVPVFHTSTCFVSGNRSGTVREEHPNDRPFPRCDELGRDLWDPDREIKECLELIAQARHRAADAFRQSEFLATAKETLRRRGEPGSGPALDDEVAKVKRKFVSERLVEAGLDRATHWGWPNIYTYTKSIGEQVIARSGLHFTIARPASCESTMVFPFPGWNEGIGTSAPFIYMALKGQVQFPAQQVTLDFVPTDIVCAGMILALGELIEGKEKPVYQMGASDVNHCTAARFCELMGLYKRKYYQRAGKGNPLVNFLQAHIEPVGVSAERLDAMGPKAIARGLRGVASLMKNVGPLRGAAHALEGAAAREEKVGEILGLFAPFTTDQRGPFSCANTREAYARLSPEDREKLPWCPEKIDWADYWHKIHMPAMEKRIVPEMDKRFAREVKPLRAHETLWTLVDEMAARHEHAPALSRVEAEGFSRVTFLDVRRRAECVAARLAARGVGKGDRVVLSAKNHPDWAIAYFGILRAGATAVPVDTALEEEAFATVVRESGAKAQIVILTPTLSEAKGRRKDLTGDLGGSFAPLRGAQDDSVVDLEALTAEDPTLVPPEVTIEEDDIASLIYTSGTTGTPKGVMLTHANFTSLIAALAPIFPLKPGDRVVSVLPLHHTFEFTCGLLLPFSRGARVVYLDELNAERLSFTLKEARATAMVGVPALWQMLERKILAQVKARGPVAEAVFEWGGEMNRMLGKTLGMDAGKILFGPVHAALGGNVKYLISGGAALPKETHSLFAGIGLRLTEGYGLTEAAPVLTVATPSPKASAGQVGKAIPGVEIKIADPDAQGVGEVLARGPNVMAGYTDEEATARVIDTDGWLHTGDLGKLDRGGRLVIVGRRKDVVVSATGENVYPDDVEARLGSVPHVAELAIVGLDMEGSSNERLACLAVAAQDDEVERATRLDRAAVALRAAIEKLPHGQRPALVHWQDAALPRTATRKVKRDEVKAILRRKIAATARPAGGANESSPARVAVAAIKGMAVDAVAPEAMLAGDLGFDSLMLTELLEALEERTGGAVDPAALQACRTVGDVDELLARVSGHGHGHGHGKAPIDRGVIEREPRAEIVLPQEVQETGKQLVGRLQDAFYGAVMRSKVYGRAHIPHNRNTIVVANHASHLDMGLVRHALGKYGEDIVSLAAQDYFFESGIKRAFFENLTNLKAIDRNANLRQTLRQAGEVISSGKTVLVFPEGTRSTSGSVQEFKPMIGHLALTHGVDILPVFLGGTHASMPKGRALPTKRDVVARIGPPLEVADLRRLTEGMSPADAAREVARLAHAAVVALGESRVLDLARAKKDEPVAEEREHPLVTLFAELTGKFKPGAAEKPVSFYFTLGNDEMAKWTVKVDGAKCDVKLGKPDGGTADCVLKTSPEIFTKIVRESYVPGPADFMSGAIKSNDVSLLFTFQKVFQLDQQP